MKGVALDYLNNNKIVREINPLYKFYSYLSEDINHDAPDTHANMMNLYQNLMDKYMIKPKLQLFGRKNMVVWSNKAVH